MRFLVSNRKQAGIGGSGCHPLKNVGDGIHLRLP